MGALELPEPEEADGPRQADGGGPPKPGLRETPDPDERGRVYEAMRAYADAEAVARPDRAPGPGGRPGETEQPDVPWQHAEQTERRPDATEQQAERTERQAEETDRQAEPTEQWPDENGQEAERTERRPDGTGGREQWPDGTGGREQWPDGTGGREQWPDGNGGRGYWAEVPRFQLMWADHVERWPAVRRPAAADRAADPPGSHRGEGGPGPERRAEIAEAIGRMREAEQGISADARTIARENPCGAWLEGFEFRLKGEDRLKEKVAAKLRDQPDSSPADVVRRIPDTIRYTFCLEPERYTAGYHDIKQRLEQHGYEMYYSENWWTNPEYKGINTRWVTAEGQRFEVQVHTPESFHAKQEVTHEAYERLRNPVTSRSERRELHSFQQDVSSWIQVPDGAPDIPDYEKEGF